MVRKGTLTNAKRSTPTTLGTGRGARCHDRRMTDAAPRVRRPPPPFRQLSVMHTEELSPRLRRIVLGGPELEGFATPAPAASVRLLLPPSGSDTIVLPTWTGNQFELPDGSRAPIRTMTPRRHDAAQRELTIDVALHDQGAVSDWARSAEPGIVTAISGPARGYEPDPATLSLVLAGDETALPAISQLFEVLPRHIRLTASIELADPSAEIALPDRPDAEATWLLTAPGATPGDAFAGAIEALGDLPDEVWVAGEAAAVQRVRRHLYDDRGISRERVSAHGYWKHGRTAS